MNQTNRECVQAEDVEALSKKVLPSFQDERYENLDQLPRNTPAELEFLRMKVLSIFMDLLPSLSGHLRSNYPKLPPEDIDEVLSKAKAKLLSLDFTKEAPPRKDAYFYTMVRHFGFNVVRENERRKERMKRARMDAETQNALGWVENERYPFDERHLPPPLRNAINNLSPKLHEVISLDVQDHTNPEIGELLELGEKTVTSRIRLARGQLGEYLRSMAPDHVEAVLGEGIFKRVDERNKAKEAKKAKKDGPKS